MAYRGVDTINLDGKGRFSIPTKHRAELQECCEGKMVGTAHRDGCLELYPLPLWEKVEEKLKKLSSLKPKEMRFKRFILGHASPCDMDGQGRILLPEQLRDFAKLEKRIVLSSLIDHFEIWAEDAWKESLNAWMNDDDADDAGLGDLGI